MMIAAARLDRIRINVEDPIIPGLPSSVSADLGDEEDPLEIRVWIRTFLNKRIMSKDPIAVEDAWIKPSGLTKLPVSLDLAAELVTVALEQIEKGSLWKGINNTLAMDTVLTALSRPPRKRTPKQDEEPDW